ncbi:MAG TPA: hypothetical protein VF061_03820 [Gemmatimonadales bacterium]
MRHLALFAALTLVAAACNTATDPADPALGEAAAPEASQGRPDLREARADLIRAGNDVSAAIGSEGIVAGLGGAFTSNGLLLSPRRPTIEGREAATTFLAGDPNAPTAMQWEVIVADVSADADQGYTWAQGTTTIDLGAGPTIIPSFYLAYWRRTDTGRWRIAAFVFNLGGPQSLPLPDGFGTPDRRHRRSYPGTRGEFRQELLATDAAFSAASVSDGVGPAFERYAAPNAIAVGGGFVFGPEAIGEAFTGGPDDVVSWEPRFAVAAGSGDLGFTVGDAVFDIPGVGMFYTKYLTVWQRQQDTKEWRFVADLGSSRPAPAT